jgi:hypothetical protein
VGYWWARFDFNEFKVPQPTGKVILMIDMLEPGFVMNPDGMTFRFFSGKQDTRRVGDFAPYLGFCFFVSERAFSVLSNILIRSGKSWPMLVGKYHYRFEFIEAIESGFDFENSKYDRYDDGVVCDIRHIALHAGFKSNYDIFRLSGDPAVTANIIVSDNFREIYENNQLTGMYFTSITS